MKYVKLFPTHNDYEAYIHNSSGVILPNVSVCDFEEEVHFNATVKEHDYIQIGGTNWATMNIGATAVTDYGKYFQWGDCDGYLTSQIGSGEGQKYFGAEDYKYNDGAPDPTAANMTKYNSTDGLTTLQLSDDGVFNAWGSHWRMPTRAEFVALGNATTSAWTNNYNSSQVKGVVLTDKNDSSKVLFFPAGGYARDGVITNAGGRSFYWSNSLYTTDAIYAYSINGASTSVGFQYNGYRRRGFLLRGVYVNN